MNEAIFEQYLEIIKELKSQNVMESNIGEEKDTYEVVITELFEAYDEYINSTQYSSYSRVLNDTLAEILNPKLLTTTVAKYNSIFGSTCQQAVNFTNGRSEIKMESKFDYVIIDEASRVNPIDLIIFDATKGIPDGMTVTNDGLLVVALWDGSRLEVFSAEGKKIDEILLPVKRPTSCTFGGADGATLLVTSSGQDLDRAAQPLNGKTLAVDGSGLSGAASRTYGALES